jgi:hypothetical protein
MRKYQHLKLGPSIIILIIILICSGKSYGETDVTFRNGRVKLAGTLDLPSGEGPFPAIVTVHGAGRLDRDYKYNLFISGYFVQQGFAVLRYDKRGVCKSSGIYKPVTRINAESVLNDLADDALAGVEFLKNHDKINPKMIGLMGISQAGWIIPLAASKSFDVAFAISHSGPTCPVGQEIYYNRLAVLFDDVSVEELTDRARYYDGLQGFDPLPSLKAVYIPILWLYGYHDRNSPSHLSIEILETLIADQNKDFSITTYTNGNHGLRETDTGQIYPAMYDSLKWVIDKFAIEN